jgi:hypothetical protein
MAVSPMLMLAFAMSIASKPAWTFGLTDVFFGSSILLAAILRYVDITSLQGETSSGGTATTRDFKAYVLGLIALAAIVWTSAQAVHL